MSRPAIVELTFHSAPDAPLHLVSHGLGAFPSAPADPRSGLPQRPHGLTSLTVATGADGSVVVPWQAIGGTQGDVIITAASSFAQGTAEVFIEVVAPMAAAPQP